MSFQPTGSSEPSRRDGFHGDGNRRDTTTTAPQWTAPEPTEAMWD